MAAGSVARSRGAAAKGQVQRGFTLIELMVALALMAVMAAVSWRGIDSLLRAQEYTQRNGVQQAIVQTALAQWNTDLDRMALMTALTPLDWDGKVLRITRASPGVRATDTPTLRVVAWSDRRVDGQLYWARWQSHPVASRSQWLAAWEAARLWSQGQSAAQYGQDVQLLPMVQWQLFYALDGRWANPLSSSELNPPTGSGDGDSGGGGAGLDQAFQNPGGPGSPSSGTGEEAAPGPRYQGLEVRPRLPDAVRLQLELAPGGGLAGLVSRDWLNPTFGSVR